MGYVAILKAPNQRRPATPQPRFLRRVASPQGTSLERSAQGLRPTDSSGKPSYGEGRELALEWVRCFIHAR